MSITVPFLSEAEIERAALTLLCEAGLHGIKGPQLIIPVENVLEKHLKLSLDFDDLHAKLGVPLLGSEPEILGALWVHSREVVNTRPTMTPLENDLIQCFSMTIFYLNGVVVGRET